MRPYEFFYLLYFLVTHPFKSIVRKINKGEKPRILLNLFMLLTFGLLFWQNVRGVILWLKPDFGTGFWLMVVITIIVYIWKYTDPSMGELWKQELKKWKERKSNGQS